MSNGPPHHEVAVTLHILARFRDGDRDALNDLYGRYFDRMLAIVRLRLGGRLRAKLDCDDVVQEAFLASLKSVDNFSGQSEGDFFHWLCTITENRIRDLAAHFRARKRDVDRETPFSPARPSMQSLFGPINDLATFTSPATKAGNAEEVLRLEEAIDCLGDSQREALLLVRYEGLSFARAGEIMNKTPDAVKMLVARAIIALGKSLGVMPN